MANATFLLFFLFLDFMCNTLCDCDWPGVPAHREQSQNYDLWSQIGCVRHSPGTHEFTWNARHTRHDILPCFQFFSFCLHSLRAESSPGTNNVWFHFSLETHEAGTFSNSISVRRYAWIINDWTVNGRALSKVWRKTLPKIFQPINFGRFFHSFPLRQQSTHKMLSSNNLRFFTRISSTRTHDSYYRSRCYQKWVIVCECKFRLSRWNANISNFCVRFSNK